MVDYFKRVYTVAEIRTGFVASSSAFLGIGYGIQTTDSIQLIPSLLIVLSAFCFNIVANIAAEIKGYINSEDDEMLTGHMGSEGLSRGDASLRDAISALCLFTTLAGVFGLLAVILTGKLILIAIGVIGLLAALLYSLTPIAFAKYPISEFVSGLMCGYLCCLVGIIIYTKPGASGFIFSFIPMIMVSFLMAANNTVDYQKDLGKRTTLAHLLGFERSITFLKPFIAVLYIIWVSVSVIVFKSVILLLIGLICLTYFGIFKWYRRYRTVTPETEQLARIYGPLPLVLLLNFNFIVGIGLMIVR